MSVVTCNATAVRFSILLCVAHKLIPTLVKKLLLSFESKCHKNKARRVETSSRTTPTSSDEHRQKPLGEFLSQGKRISSLWKKKIRQISLSSPKMNRSHSRSHFTKDARITSAGDPRPECIGARVRAEKKPLSRPRR